MSNTPNNSKLSTSQFGGVTGPSDSELVDIEQGGEDSYYTPERIEAMRADYATKDANYAAVRNARLGRRGTGGMVPNSIGGAIETGGTFEDYGSSFGDSQASADTIFGNVSNGVLGKSTRLGKTGEVGAGEGSADPSFGQSEETTGRSRRFGGAGFGGMDIEAGPRASSFDRNLPSSPNEAAARQQGIMYLKIAGPTCNHPNCQAYRARGVELLGRGLGSDRRIVNNPGVAQMPEQAIPSVRKDKPIPQAVLRPESADVPFGQRKGSFGTGQSTDMGDFAFDYKNTMKVPEYEPADKKNPDWVTLSKQFNAQGSGKNGERDIFGPDDYLEHQHHPDEVNYKLPWEA